MANDVELVLDARAELGEGPIWHAASQTLYWVDIVAGLVHLFDPATGQDRVIAFGRSVGTIVPRCSGGAVLALADGFAGLDFESGALRPIADPESHLPQNRFNDGKCDPQGRFWAGTTQIDETVRGYDCGLYCLDANLEVRKMLDGVSTSNGIAWSLDSKTMYYIDSPTRRVDAFDFDPADGAISNRRAIIEVPEEMGSPDGMTIDSEDMIWVALWGGHRVVRWDPRSGELLQTIRVPAPKATACAFGGPNLDELYITTARIFESVATLRAHPLAGGVFRARPGVRGIEAYEFEG